MESTTSRPLHTVGTGMEAAAEEMGRRGGTSIMHERERTERRGRKEGHSFSLVCVCV